MLSQSLLKFGKIFSKHICEVGFRYVKSVQIRSFLWPVFSRIWTEYGEILHISPYSVRMQKNTEQKNSECGLFSGSDINFKYVLNHSICYLCFLLFMGLLSPCHLKSVPHLPTMGDDILTQRQNR